MRRDVIVPDGHRLAVWTRAGRGLPVLVVHGGPDFGSGYLRHHLPAALPRDTPLVFVDLPGTGRSDAREDPTLSGMADDLRSIVDALELESFVPLGHSFGGLIAPLLAIRTPERVAGMVLVDPDPPRRAAWDAALTTLEARRPAEDRARLEALDASGGWRTSVEAATAYLQLRIRTHAYDPSAVDGMVFDLPEARLPAFGAVGAEVRRRAGRWDLTDVLARVTAPTLIVSGPASPYPLRSLEELRDALPSADLRLLDGTGHFPFLEAAAEFRRSVGAFLASRGIAGVPPASGPS